VRVKEQDYYCQKRVEGLGLRRVEGLGLRRVEGLGLGRVEGLGLGIDHSALLRVQGYY
jgi:hypothetical protein